jgi:hypothetical protein
VAKQTKYLTSLLTGTLVFAAWLPGCSHTMARAPGETQEWGQGQLKASERAYYVDRVNRILEVWRGMTRQAERRNPGETVGTSYLCLVVDTEQKELWVESDGRLLPQHHSDLPAGMDWSLYQVVRGDSSPLPPLSRFRLPGVSARSDRVLLLGRNEAMYVYFSFSSGGVGSGYGVGAGDVIRSGASVSPLAKTMVENTYESLVVSPADYEKARAGFRSTVAPVEPVALTQNKALWLRVEKRLYQEMEQQVSRRGWQLSDLKVECGPDYTAATAQVYSARPGPLPLLSRKPRSVRTELRIDSLGNDIWYVQSALPPSSRRSAHPDFEFLVSATGSVPEPDRAALLQEGRTRQQEVPVAPASKWRVQLPNGTMVELVGICENPSVGKPWWGPDGSLLGYTPCSTYERFNLPGNCAAYDIAWRVDPPQEGGLQVGSTSEGCWGAYRGQMRDRYGKVIDMGLDIGDYVFDRSREKTTLEFTVKNVTGAPTGVTFKNISLVCGKNPGFEIEVVR